MLKRMSPKSLAVGLGLSLVLMLAGCSKPQGNGVPGLPAPPPLPAKAAAAVQQNSKANTPTGLTLALAAEILNAGSDPFTSKLPEEEASAENGEIPGLPEPPPSNPLDQISLLGIVYRPGHPMALISVSDTPGAASVMPTSGTGQNTQMVRPGQTIQVGDSAVRVKKITETLLALAVVGKPDQARELELPDIVGYSATSSGSSPKKEAKPADTLKLEEP